MFKFKFFYHGSPFNLKTLEPKPSNVLGGEKALFATPYRSVALCFAAGQWSDDDIDLGEINGQLNLIELKKGAFKVFNTPGWLYVLPDVGLLSDARLTSFEVYTKATVTPIAKTHIKNIFDEIIASEEMIITPYHD